MANFKYPSNDLQNPVLIASMLGSFWSDVFEGKQQVFDYMEGRAREAQQNLSIAKENQTSLNRYDIPVYHKEYVKRLTLVESSVVMAEITSSSINYGDDASTSNNLYYAYEIDNSIKAFSYASDKLLASSFLAVSGTDCYLDTANSYILFRDNPFDNTEVVRRYYYDSVGTQTESEIDLWLFDVSVDRENVYTQYGYIVSVKDESSETYKKLIASTFDSLMFGPGELAFKRVVAAMTGVPVVESDNETVVAIFSDTRNLVIVTDVNVYKYKLGSTAIVEVGDVVDTGEQLVDTVKMYDFSTGYIPTDLTSISLSTPILLGDFSGPLTFNNTDVATTVSSDINGKTVIEWDIDGDPADVTLFWGTTHANGVAADETLANLLDNRTNPTDEPIAQNLPTTINPMGFAITNLLRNVILLKVKEDYFGDDAYGLVDNDPLLRKVKSANKTILINRE